jgi:hypothetical protein
MPTATINGRRRQSAKQEQSQQPDALQHTRGPFRLRNCQGNCSTKARRAAAESKSDAVFTHEKIPNALQGRPSSIVKRRSTPVNSNRLPVHPNLKVKN